MSTSTAPIRRIGAVGDVHCEDRLLAVAIDRLEAMELDVIVCVGDIVDGVGDADRCVELLDSHGIVTVAGNHERWFLEETRPKSLKHVTRTMSETSRAWMSSLATTRHLETLAGGLTLCHGVGQDDMSMLKPDTRGYALQDIPALRELMLDPAVNFMLGGHTHERMVRRFQGLTVVNCGTLRQSDEPSVSVIDFELMKVEHFALAESGLSPLEAIELPRPAPLPVGAHG